MSFRKQKFRGRGGGSKFKRYFEQNANNYDSGNTGDFTTKKPSQRRCNFHDSGRHTNSRGSQQDYQNYDQQIYDNRMDEESSMYFKIVYERMHEPFEDDEERDVFVENVVEQMQGKEAILVMSSLGSKTLQKVLDLNTQSTVFVKIIEALQNSVESMSVDKYASLALQSLLTYSLKHLETDEEARNKIIEFVLIVAEFCIFKYPVIVHHPFQNYILKTIIHVLSGNTVFSFKKNQFLCQPVFHEVPPVFQETLKKLSNCILLSDQIEENLQVDIFSILVQHLLKASSNFPEIANHIANFILEILLKSEQGEDMIHPYLTGASSSHLIEATIEHFDSKQYKLFMRKYILKHLQKIIEHKQANNILKTVIWKTKKKKAFEKLFDKLEPYFKLVFNLEHDTILVALADGCLRFDVCQARFVNSLKDMLECSGGDGQNYFVLCVMHMLICEHYVKAESENTASISLNGSLLVQRLLGFSKPIKIAMAIVSMNLDNLKRISCDPKGCHVIDAFMNSKFVGEKSRDKLVEKIKEISITLACSPHGSRSIDAIWANASPKQKIMMADSLAKNEEVLTGNRFGKYVHKNLALYHFKHRFEEWKQVQTSQDKKRKLFTDILGDNEHGVKKNKNM